MSRYVMVLNDGETFTNLDGCFIVEVPEGVDIETFEHDVLPDAEALVLFLSDTDLRHVGTL